MKIPLDDIKAYSKCPAYYAFNKRANNIPSSARSYIISKIIKKCYIRHSEVGYKIPWRIILNWINKEILKHISIEEGYDAAKKLNDSIVTPLHHWYINSYKQEEYEGYVHVPVSAIAGGCEISDTIEIIKMSNPITLVSISEVVNSKVQMYNDFKVRGQLWLVSEQLKIDELKAEHILIGPTRALEVTQIDCTKELNQRTAKSIGYIAEAIRNKICYPSITLACGSCPFVKECVL